MQSKMLVEITKDSLKNFNTIKRWLPIDNMFLMFDYVHL